MVQELPTRTRLSYRAIEYGALGACLGLLCGCLASLCDPPSTQQKVQADTAASVPAKPRPFSKDAVEHYNKGVDLHQKGFLDQSIVEYRAAVDADERLGQAWHNMGNIYRAQGHYDEAINSFKSALAIKKDPITLDAYGSVLFSIGKPKEAMTLWQQALEIDPKDADASSLLARALDRSGKTDDAEMDRNKYHQRQSANGSVQQPAAGSYITPAGKP